MKRAAITTMLASVLLVAGAPAGAKRVEQVATRVTIHDSCQTSKGATFECRPAPRRNYSANFYGRVKSAVGKCERRRTVKIINTDPPGTRRRGTQVIGTTKSGSDGKWSFSTSPSEKPGPGDYRAKVTRQRKGDVICKAATSKRELHAPI